MDYLSNMTNYKDWSKSQDYYSNLTAGATSALTADNGADLSAITGSMNDINSALSDAYATAQGKYNQKVSSADTEEVSAQARLQEMHTGLEAGGAAMMALPAGIKATKAVFGKAAGKGADLAKSGRSAVRDAQGPQTSEVEEEKGVEMGEGEDLRGDYGSGEAGETTNPMTEEGATFDEDSGLRTYKGGNEAYEGKADLSTTAEEDFSDIVDRPGVNRGAKWGTDTDEDYMRSMRSRNEDARGGEKSWSPEEEGELGDPAEGSFSATPQPRQAAQGVEETKGADVGDGEVKTDVMDKLDEGEAGKVEDFDMGAEPSSEFTDLPSFEGGVSSAAEEGASAGAEATEGIAAGLEEDALMETAAGAGNPVSDMIGIGLAVTGAVMFGIDAFGWGADPEKHKAHKEHKAEVKYEAEQQDAQDKADADQAIQVENRTKTIGAYNKAKSQISSGSHSAITTGVEQVRNTYKAQASSF